MKRKVVTAVLAAMMAVTSVPSPVFAQDETGTFAEDFANPTDEDAELKVRYWLPSGYPAANEDLLKEIDRELKELADAGYSTVEFANVYEGLSDDAYKQLEEGDGKESYLFGSSYWKETLRQVLKSAKTYGMKVDVTMGPHWPAASDEIDINSDAVMKEAIYSTTELKSGETYTELQHNYVGINENDSEIHLLGVYAAKYTNITEQERSVGYGPNATTVTWNQYALDDSTLTKLEPQEDGTYNFEAPSDDYVVIEIYEHSTGATIGYSTYDNAETNYTGYCLDMYNSAGAEEFIRYFETYCIDDEIVELLKEVGGNFFEDNFNYNAENIWTSTLPETFEENCGYSMEDVFPYTLGIYAQGHSSLRNYTGTDMESTAPFVIADDTDYKFNRVQADMIDTWGKCYLDQHIQTIMTWAHEKFDMGFRTQTYGGNIDSGLAAATVDRPEGETIGFSDQFDGFSMLAAGRDMGEKSPTLTSEFGASFATGGAYGYAWDDLTSAAYKDYSAGVNSLFFHGYSYMYAPDVTWPGFAAFGELACSGTWSSRDPQWTQIDMLSGNLRRNQYALLQGTQKTDVAVYESLGNAQGGGPFYDGSALLEKGYSYQLFTPGLLSLDDAVVEDGILNPEGPGYQALVLDDETAVSKENMEKLLEFAQDGLTIIFANKVPCISTSLKEENTEIESIMEQLLALDNVYQVENSEQVGDALENAGIVPATAKENAESAIIPIHRSSEEGDIYFLYNSSEEEVSNTITLKGKGEPCIMDTWDGKILSVTDYTSTEDSVTLDVTIGAGDSLLIGVGDGFTPNGEAVSVSEVSDNAISIDEWNLSVESWTSGDENDAAVTAKDVIFEGTTQAVSWSENQNIGNGISGIGTYTTTFDWSGDYEGAILSFTEVGETFEVYVNDQLLYPDQVTKKVDISSALKEGENTLKVVVASSLQNAVNAKNGLDGEKEYGIIGTTTITPYNAK